MSNTLKTDIKHFLFHQHFFQMCIYALTIKDISVKWKLSIFNASMYLFMQISIYKKHNFFQTESDVAKYTSF